MTAVNPGQSLQLYFVDGKPDGMVTADVFNWSGQVLVTPRTRLKEALERPTSSFTGVYILVGEKDGKPLAYIGEGESIADRIRSHEAKKDWWTSAVLVTSTGNSLHKAHVKYLEARLVEEAKKVGDTLLENGNIPPKPGLSEADSANMEAFLGFLFLVLPAVRLDMFVQNTRPSSPNGPDKTVPASLHPAGSGVKFVIDTQKHGLKAEALVLDGEFVVLAGSQARLDWEGQEKATSGYATLHEKLRQSGVLQPSGNHCVFQENYAFSSSSAAAAVVYGRQTQGPTAWRTPSGQTYKEWEAAQLGA
jgi:hypothetical protein